MTPPSPDNPSLPPAPPLRWTEASLPERAAVTALEEALSLPTPLCSLLLIRGLADPEEAKAFLRPLLSTLSDPFLLAGMREAVARLDRALEDGETILVHGDYDADGICGAALLTRWLRRLGGRVEPFVPDRLRHGYDFGPGGLEAAEAAGASLVVTVDCGIRAHDAVAEAAARGIDVVVTDHHAPGVGLPDAVAVVNPARSDCTSPAGPLSGTGVAYALCRALAERRDIPDEELHRHLDLVAVATVADLVPLSGENRTLVRFGLRALRRTAKEGLRALLRETGADPEEVDSGSIGYVLAPRINAAGRIGDAGAALRLLVTSDPDEARELAAALEDTNRRRREEDRRIEEEALQMLARSYDPDRDFGVVMASEEWHPGVIGIVASRLVERIHRPVVLISLEDGRGRGSARSVRGFHLAEALERCEVHLERYGGHAMAAGMDLRREALDEFRRAFSKEARRALRDRELSRELSVDLTLSLADATSELHKLLGYFGPFGMGNRRPVFLSRRVRCAGPARTVGGGHLKLVLQQAGHRLEAIGFGLAERIEPGSLEDRELDAVFQLRMNRYRGRSTLQARLLDLRPSKGSDAGAAVPCVDAGAVARIVRGDTGAAAPLEGGP